MSCDLADRNTTVRDIVDIFETRASKKPDIPLPCPQDSFSSATTTDASPELRVPGIRLPVQPTDEGDNLGFPLDDDTATACLTARVARLNQNQVEIAVDAPPSKNDFVAYARNHGLEKSAAKSEVSIPTLVHYRTSCRCADLWVQVETGHIVFAFGKKTLGCVHISEVHSMEALETKEPERKPVPQKSTSRIGRSATPQPQGRTRERTFSLRFRSSSRTRSQQAPPKPEGEPTARCGATPDVLSAIYPQRIALQIAGRPVPLIVGFKSVDGRRSALQKLSVLRSFFEETAIQAQRRN